MTQRVRPSTSRRGSRARQCRSGRRSRAPGTFGDFGARRRGPRRRAGGLGREVAARGGAPTAAPDADNGGSLSPTASTGSTNGPFLNSNAAPFPEPARPWTPRSRCAHRPFRACNGSCRGRSCGGAIVNERRSPAAAACARIASLHHRFLLLLLTLLFITTTATILYIATPRTDPAAGGAAAASSSSRRIRFRSRRRPPPTRRRASSSAEADSPSRPDARPSTQKGCLSGRIGK